jgi:hypothetical protein
MIRAAAERNVITERMILIQTRSLAQKIGHVMIMEMIINRMTQEDAAVHATMMIVGFNGTIDLIPEEVAAMMRNGVIGVGILPAIKKETDHQQEIAPKGAAIRNAEAEDTSSRRHFDDAT